MCALKMAVWRTALLLAAVAVFASVCKAAPTPQLTEINSNSSIQRVFAKVDYQLKRFSDLDQVIGEFTKPCKELKNISLALANHCVNYVSDRAARATSFGAMSGDLVVDDLWSTYNKTIIFVQTISQAFHEHGIRGALKAFAEIKDFLDMDEATIRQVAADLDALLERKFEQASADLQKRWPQDAEYIQDAERFLRPELHEGIRDVLRILGLADDPVTREPPRKIRM